jgi:hypothetical protein
MSVEDMLFSALDFYVIIVADDEVGGHPGSGPQCAGCMGGSHALAEYSRGVEAFAELALHARCFTEYNRVMQEQSDR